MCAQMNYSYKKRNTSSGATAGESGDTGGGFVKSCGQSTSQEGHSIYIMQKSGSDIVLKEPWIPPPGRTSMSGSHIEETKNTLPYQENVMSNRSFFSSSNVPTSKKKHAAGKTRRARNSSRNVNNLSGYKLKTKDSLVDVAACLTEKRTQVLKLWEKNLPEMDATLLGDFEKANVLALDAARDVDELRKSIQDLQKKPLITVENTNKLDDLRVRIISKLELFEETHSNIQKRLYMIRSSSNVNAAAGESRESLSRNRSSQTNLPSQKSSSISPLRRRQKPRKSRSNITADNLRSLSVLKEKPQVFSDGETDNENEIDFDRSSVSKLLNSGNNAHGSKSKVDPAKIVESIEDLSKLYHLYTNKKFILSTVKEVSEHSEGKSERNRDDFSRDYISDNTHAQYEFHSEEVRDHESTCIYREKINNLHQKLLDQESKYEDLSREIKRIESQSGFDMKMLKSNMKDRLDELESFPELLQLTEKRLNDSLQIKHALETSLKLKSQELNGVKKEIQKLTTELYETKQKHEAEVQTVNLLQTKNHELEGVNTLLRGELKTNNEHTRRLEIKLSGKIPVYGKSHKNVLMEDRISELERELAREKKRCSILKEAKDNISIQMARRQEELMESLEDSRRRNRTLQNQMLLIKSSYQTIFPKNLLSSNKYLQELSAESPLEENDD